MASAASDMLEYGMWLLWTFLTLTPASLKNPIHAIVLPTQDVVEELMSDSLLAFPPGLLDVLQAATPPSVAYFKSLPADVTKRFAVYLLVLEKQGCRPIIYVGSGTKSLRGVVTRFRDYETKVHLPHYVKYALDDGYTIVHKGLLCWCPVPTAEKCFVVRTLILALEATFSIVLWAMRSKTKDYGMPKHLCPWQIDALDYDGCCSHVAIYEQIWGEDDGLTPEQIAAKSVELKQRRLDQQKAAYYGAKNSDFAAWKATRRMYESKRDLEEKRESCRKSKAKAKAERRFACSTCDLPFEDQNLLNMHYLTKRHVDKVNGVPAKVAKNPKFKTWAEANIAAKKYYCKTCDFTTSTTQKLDSHLSSQRHKKRAAAASGSSS